MQRSSYAFPVAEMAHLLSLCILGGAILIVNLRLLGLGVTSQSAGQLAQELKRYLIAALIGSIVSGVLLVAGEPLKCYDNSAFRLKMLLLALAIFFYFAIQQRLLKLTWETPGRAFLLKCVGVFSMLLWLSVGLAGRAIGII